MTFFTASAYWADSVFKLECPSVVCVCQQRKLDTSGQREYCLYWHTSRQFFVVVVDLKIFLGFGIKKGTLQTSLLLQIWVVSRERVCG